jgi:hypothetical protein
LIALTAAFENFDREESGIPKAEVSFSYNSSELKKLPNRTR